MKIAASVRLLLIVLWVGSLWTCGYLIAPTLFLTLPDRMLAGTIAGKIFRAEAWLSVFLALSLATLFLRTVAERRNRNALLTLCGAMFACTLLGYFLLQPMMAALRESAPGGILVGTARTQFAVLHGVAAGIYLIQSLFGIGLVLKNARCDASIFDR